MPRMTVPLACLFFAVPELQSRGERFEILFVDYAEFFDRRGVERADRQRNFVDVLRAPFRGDHDHFDLVYRP